MLLRNFKSVVYGNKYVTIDQYNSIFYSKDGLTWKVKENENKNNDYIKYIDYNDCIFYVNDFYIKTNVMLYKFSISRDGINYKDKDTKYKIEKIISKDDVLLVIGFDKNFNKNLLYYNKKKNNTFEFESLCKGRFRDIIFTDNKAIILEEHFIYISNNKDFIFASYLSIDKSINCENNITHKAIYIKEENRCLIFDTKSNIYSLDLENNKLEKIGYIPDRRYLYDIKYKDGLFVIACSGDKNDFLWYSRDGINYKQANISIDSSNKLKHRKTTYNNFIMSLACNNNSFVAVGSNNLILHSYDGINYTICKL